MLFKYSTNAIHFLVMSFAKKHDLVRALDAAFHRDKVNHYIFCYGKIFMPNLLLFWLNYSHKIMSK